MGRHRSRSAVGELVVRAGRGLHWHPATPRDAHGTGTVGTVHRHQRDARQGGADRRSAPRRTRAQHSGDARRHQAARGGRDMTLRVGVSAMPLTSDAVVFVAEAERLGADSVWVPEFWAADALTPLAYLAASTSKIRLATGIVQLGARTPAMLAMSALSLQALSRGRFVLGLGTSGPQVMEGWHGVRFDRPVRRTRETIEIIRSISAGER